MVFTVSLDAIPSSVEIQVKIAHSIFVTIALQATVVVGHQKVTRLGTCYSMEMLYCGLAHASFPVLDISTNKTRVDQFTRPPVVVLGGGGLIRGNMCVTCSSACSA
jgi:hypothetical protein